MNSSSFALVLVSLFVASLFCAGCLADSLIFEPQRNRSEELTRHLMDSMLAKMAPRDVNHQFNALALMSWVVVTALGEDGRIALGNGSGRIIHPDGGSVYAQSEVSTEKDPNGRVSGVIHDGVWRPPVSVYLMGREVTSQTESNRLDVKAGTPVFLLSSFLKEQVAPSLGSSILVLDVPAELSTTMRGPYILAQDLIIRSH